MKDNTIQKLVKAGLLAAMIFLLTAGMSIRIPGGTGYINLGDAGVLTAAALLGGWWGAACAGIGSALADLFLVVGVYAPATLVIKGGMALLAAFLLKKMPKKLSIVALLLSALLVPVGYFVYESLLYGVPSAWVNVGFNTMQCIVGALVAQVLIAAIHVATGTGKKD